MESSPDKINDTTTSLSGPPQDQVFTNNSADMHSEPEISDSVVKDVDSKNLVNSPPSFSEAESAQNPAVELSSSSMDYLDDSSQGDKPPPPEESAQDSSSALIHDEISVGNTCDNQPIVSKCKAQSSEDVSMGVVDSSKAADSTGTADSGSVLLCRLCAAPCHDQDPVFLFQHPPHHPEVLPKDVAGESAAELVGDILSMIKETLPIKVSCCDRLPKQVCKMCVERLRLSHAFATNVLKAESNLISLRENQKMEGTNEEINHNSMISYDCPVCKETPLLLAKPCEPPWSSNGIHGKNCSWEKITIKDEPEDPVEPSHEELEKSYHEFFGGQHDLDTFRTEERITLKPSKPAGLGGRRPRGRPRSRPPKVTPRGRRGRRSVNTTVEKILELSEASYDNDEYGFKLRSKENNPASEALTQCLLCEQWLPGSAACLQHSLSTHMDCGAFLCPRCPRDDFPGDFELIQHYQESHCPDLELYEVFQVDRNSARLCNTSEREPQVEAEPPMEPERSEHCTVKQENRTGSASWTVEAMDYEILNSTPPNELYESQDEVSSSLSELAARSMTSHSALFEEESNSLSTQGSDSNLATEDILGGQVRDRHVLRDKMIGEASGLVDEVSFSASPCTLGVGDFGNDLGTMEEESQDNTKLLNKPSFHKSNSENTGDITVESESEEGLRNNYKPLQEDSQGSQDSLKTDDLCGFQEAINEKSEEVNLNGSTIHFDSDMASSADNSDLNAI